MVTQNDINRMEQQRDLNGLINTLNDSNLIIRRNAAKSLGNLRDIRAVVPLINALESRKDRDIILCVKNDGAIRDLADNCSVEITSKVSRRGIRPHKVGGCPHFLKGLFIAQKESDRLAVDSVRHKSYESALQSLAVNPLVPSLGAARKFLDKVIQDEKIELH